MLTPKIILFAFAVWICTAYPGPPPIPTPPAGFCSGKANGDYDYDQSCFHFVKCYDEIAHVFICPANLFWNETGKRCDYTSDDPTCSSPCSDQDNSDNEGGPSPAGC